MEQPQDAAHGAFTAHESDRLPSIEELARKEPTVRSDPGCVRMFHLDGNRRLKLQPLLEMTFPVLFDCWRGCFDMDALLKEGIWSRAIYVEAETESLPLAGGQPAELRASIAAARPIATRAGSNGIVLATDITVFAHRSGNHGTNFASRAAETLERAGCLRVLWNLVRPFAPPSEQVVCELPPQMHSLTLRPSMAPPTADQLAITTESFAPVAPPPAEVFAHWSIHHTDANRIVYTGTYLARAEERFADLVQTAGLPVGSLHTRRARMRFRRPFEAGQPYSLRGKLVKDAGNKALEGVLSFHTPLGVGASDDRPAVLVRFDASVQ